MNAFLHDSSSYRTKLLSYREQEKVMDGWLKKRLHTILPMIMKRWDVDMWIVACKEYNEDPMLASLTPCAMMGARRTTILMFSKEAEDVRCFSITRPNVGLDGYYESVWTMAKGQNWGVLPKTDYSSREPETQMECIKRIINMRKPKNIALDMSEAFAFGDGLSATMKEAFDNILSDLKVPVISAEKLCVSWLETRLPEELDAYHGIVEIAHAIIHDAFSSKVILPGITTNHDVKYFMMQRMLDMGLVPTFDVEVSIKRAGGFESDDEEIIMPHDFLHCDMGFRYLGLCTDTQENAYILGRDEEDAPVGLVEGMKIVNRLQDIVMNNYKVGRSGNEILKLSREQAVKEGITPCIYCHPIGYHCHGAGPAVGLWDMQQGLPGLQGTYPLFNNTLYSLELNATVNIPEWNDDSFVYPQETDIIFCDDKAYFAAPRQTKLHLIR